MEYYCRKIIKAGNSHVITLATDFLKRHSLKKGDYIRLDKITKVKIEIKEVKEPSRQRKLPSPEVDSE